MPVFVRSSVPLYAQLESALREGIRRGQWGPGDPLPSDRKLAEDWRVSRCTVRQALDILVRDGLVERRQGKGTFVMSSQMLRDFIGYYTFAGPEDEPMHLETQIISFGVVEASAQVGARLRIMPGAQVLLLKLLRLANGRPVLLLTSYMPVDLCTGLREEDFLAYPVLTEVISSRCSVPVVGQRRSVRATVIQGEDARLLQLQPGSLGLDMERVSYTDFQRPVEYGFTLMRNEQCTYVLDISHAGGRVGRVARENGSARPQRGGPGAAVPSE